MYRRARPAGVSRPTEHALHKSLDGVEAERLTLAVEQKMRQARRRLAKAASVASTESSVTEIVHLLGPKGDGRLAGKMRSRVFAATCLFDLIETAVLVKVLFRPG